MIFLYDIINKNPHRKITKAFSKIRQGFLGLPDIYVGQSVDCWFL